MVVVVTVAAFNALEDKKLEADFVCAGVNDQEVIKAAMEKAQRILFTEGDFNIEGPLWA